MPAVRAPTNLSYDGEVYTLYVLPDHQGAGHGRGLLGALFSALSAAGCRSALVWVLAENPARFFYEAMGGTLIATREEPFHGVVLSECSYGWPDLRPSRRNAHAGLRQKRLVENRMLATRSRRAARPSRRWSVPSGVGAKVVSAPPRSGFHHSNWTTRWG